MITALHLENLKCYETLSLPLAPLTLLTGFNAGGKSTAMQGLLLVAQTLRQRPRTRWLNLNGPLVQLGTVSEILNEDVKEREISIGIETQAAKITWRLNPEERIASTALGIDTVEIAEITGQSRLSADGELQDLVPASSQGTSSEIRDLLSAIRNLIFVSAVRDGTQEVFSSPNTGEPTHADVGIRGEFAAWWFERMSDEYVPDERRLRSEQGATLRRQLSAWGSELFPGFEATAQSLQRTGLVQLQLRTKITEDWRRPSNVGYGLSYAFPILVAGLLANSGQLLIVDSPEAHLHPRAQSRMGEFLACMAAADVRIILETHSDHVLNGVRLAVKKGNIRPEQAAIYFFAASHAAVPNQQGATPASRVLAAHIDKEGGINIWPDGFFDQAEKDMASLAGWL